MRAWHWAEVAPLVRPGITLPPELEPELELGLEAVVAPTPVTAVTVALGGVTVVPAATDVTTIGAFVVVVTFGDVATIVATAVVAPPDEVLTVTAGRVKAEQVSSKVLINLFAESSTSEVGVSE